MSLLSPGVKWSELDFSTYAAQLATSVFAVVGESEKGEVGVPIEIAGATEMLAKIGKPNPNFTDKAVYALDQYFKFGSRAFFIRIARANAVAAESPTIQNAGGTEDLFRIKANSVGTWGNDYAISIANVQANNEFDLVVEVLDPTTGQYSEIERFDAVTLDPSAEREIENIVNDGIDGTLQSQYVVLDLIYDWSDGPVSPAEGRYVLGDTSEGGIAGSHGTGNLIDSDYVGNRALGTGIYAIQDSDTYDINVLAAPGAPDPSGNVANAIKEICEVIRQDCFGIVDPPEELSIPYNSPNVITNIKNWRTNTLSGGGYNSSYTSIFWPWAQVYDSYNKRKVWLPPSGFVAQRIAYTDFLADPWFSPAGLNRGILPDVLKIGFVTNQGQRDILYDRFVNINCIKKEPGEGFVIWGNRTNQVKPSARDQITVRRMLLYLQKTIATSVKYLVFEPNDPTMWNTFKTLVNPVFERVKDGRGIEEYAIIMDGTTNNALRRSRKEAYGIFKIIPTNTAEKILMDFALFNSGARFS